MYKTLLLLFLYGSILKVYSQSIPIQLITTAGDTYTNSISVVDWSLGEIMIETHQNGSIMLSQGFQQGKFQTLEIEINPYNSIKLTVFPNPTQEFIEVLIADFKANTALQYNLTDIKGKLIKSGTISTQTDKIDLSWQLHGTYILSIIYKGEVKKSISVVKY